ncbi:MAG: hypothetical protein H6813_06030 [Phycisphaeraceae bacterium]|nr:hypothetical protein [Phycisphaeraceae bacterium]MCB9848028.1 hypothetical protein [Phycisphaeraceae bacterium]
MKKQQMTGAALLGFLVVSPARGAHLEPVAGDGLSPVIPVLQHSAALSWTHITDGVGTLESAAHDGAMLEHIVEQSPGSPSAATTSVRFSYADSDGFQPANLLVSWPIGDPLRGVRASAQTTSEITQVGVSGVLSSARQDIGAPPGGDTAAGSWFFRLDPTGSEMPGEPAQVRAFASIDGQVVSSSVSRASARVRASFTVNGETVLESDTFTDETLPNEVIDESNLFVMPVVVGDVIEIGFSAQTDAMVVGSGPRLGTAEVTAIRYDIEIRLIRAITDFNHDGVIDTADLGKLLANFGQMGTNYDLNADGVIDTADIGLLVSVFGMPSL